MGEVLEVAAHEGGVWRLTSSSSTVYFIDLDRRRLLRQRGAGSPRGEFDGVWVPLVSFNVVHEETEMLRVGARMYLLTDPLGGGFDYRYWIPRTCTGLQPVDGDDVP